ncbi:UDP-glucosyltransferase 2-like [Eupeodes corollae]|uniref:UDP-glucosyltransferase 2-like n=1 Tax=Eupeodes corollae TaxID=290404 RepID=UPI0024905675|nr:UDP-glucosyltransferase 2-like [Eupeodes corollae]
MARTLILFVLNREYFKSNDYPSLTSMQNNVSLVLCNHHFSEGAVEAHLPNMVEISGIQISDKVFLPKELQEFMDSADNGVIYFSLGTVVSAGELEPLILNTFVKVLSSMPQKVIWKIENLVTNYSNIFTSKWLPQSGILAHPKVKLFISHGGKGSTIEALYYAVPMLVLPFFGDQFANARRIKNKGFGLELDNTNLNYLKLRQSIFEVLNNNTYYTNIKTASNIFKDRPFTAEETATYWIDYVIRHRGAVHMKDRSKKSSFIQYHSIDVYLWFSGFLCAVYILREIGIWI